MFNLLKTEFVRRQGPWRNLTHVELALSEWVEWYNTRRLHSWCSYVPPVEYEQQHYRDTPSRQPPDRDNQPSSRPEAIQGVVDEHLTAPR